jgi:hypothetical protein
MTLKEEIRAAKSRLDLDIEELSGMADHGFRRTVDPEVGSPSFNADKESALHRVSLGTCIVE